MGGDVKFLLKRNDQRNHGGGPQQHEQPGPLAMPVRIEAVQYDPLQRGGETEVTVVLAIDHEGLTHNCVAGNIQAAMRQTIGQTIVVGVEAPVGPQLAVARGDHPEARGQADDAD